jgi:hypothetical protein
VVKTRLRRPLPSWKGPSRYHNDLMFDMSYGCCSRGQGLCFVAQIQLRDQLQRLQHRMVHSPRIRIPYNRSPVALEIRQLSIHLLDMIESRALVEGRMPMRHSGPCETLRPQTPRPKNKSRQPSRLRYIKRFQICATHKYWPVNSGHTTGTGLFGSVRTGIWECFAANDLRQTAHLRATARGSSPSLD